MRFLRTLFLTALFLLGVGRVCEASQFTAPAVTVTNTTTTKLDIPKGDGLGAVFYVNVTAIGAGDTWTFKLTYVDAAGTSVDVSSVTSGITSTGKTALVVASPFSGGTSPFPTHVVATRSVNGGTPTVTYTISGFLTNSAAIDKVKANTLEVCKAGCRFSTIQSALDTITDSSLTNPYTIQIGPGVYSDTVTIGDSFVTLRGAGRTATIITSITTCGTAGPSICVANDLTGVNMENLTVQSFVGYAAGQVSRGRHRFTDVTFGTLDASDDPLTGDCLIDLGGLKDIEMYGVNCNSTADGYLIGPDSTLTTVANYIRLGKFTGNQVGNPRAFRLSDASACARGIWDNGSRIDISTTTSVISPSGSAMEWDITGSTACAKSTYVFSGTTVNFVQRTDGSGSPTPRCWYFKSALAAVPTTVDLIGTHCNISMADAGATARAIDIDADADFANWTIRVVGGDSVLSGGTSRLDIDNASTDVTPSISGWVHSGSYTGAGAIAGGDSRYGAATTRFQVGQGDLVAATCTVGEIKADTAGATQEFCWCIAGPAWACVSATTTTGPTN